MSKLRTSILCAAAAVLASCATVDPAALEAAAVRYYRDAAAAVVLGAASREAGAKALEEGDRLARQYAALAVLKGLPQESAAVKEARQALEAALR